VQFSGDDGFGVISSEFCMWVRFPGGVRLVEVVALLWRNKFLLVFVHLAVTHSDAGGRPMRWCQTGSGGRTSDWVVRHARVWGWRLVVFQVMLLLPLFCLDAELSVGDVVAGRPDQAPLLIGGGGCGCEFGSGS
jgi:hypothetical protein